MKEWTWISETTYKEFLQCKNVIVDFELFDEQQDIIECGSELQFEITDLIENNKVNRKFIAEIIERADHIIVGDASDLWINTRFFYIKNEKGFKKTFCAYTESDESIKGFEEFLIYVAERFLKAKELSFNN